MKHIFRHYLHRAFKPRRHAILRQMLARQRWNRAQLAQYQQKRLQYMIALAREHTDFYARKYADVALDAPLEAYPILTKAEVRAQGRAMVNRQLAPRRIKTAHTGGSTGQPLTYYYTEEKTEIMRALKVSIPRR